MATISLVPIVPKRITSPATLQRGIVNAARESNRVIKAQFERTTRTWRRRPPFTSTIVNQPNQVVGDTGTDSEIYGYINDGTSIRYAVMTPDFTSKTRPGNIDASRGSGGFSHFNFRQPRPGIEARRFDHTIARLVRPDIERILERELDRVVRESGLT